MQNTLLNPLRLAGGPGVPGPEKSPPDPLPSTRTTFQPSFRAAVPMHHQQSTRSQWIGSVCIWR